MRRAFLATAAAFLVLAAPAGAAVRFGACPGPAHAGGRCATVNIPLDRTGEIPGTIGIGIERVAARGRSRGTVLALAGGPGDAASSVFARARGTLDALRTEHDVVLVDQRGTGRSQPIDCPEVARGEPGATAACAARLGQAVHLYTTAAFTDDLDEVRRALGVKRATIYGVSYGGYAALAYARRHPGGVERLILDSPVDQRRADDAFDLDTLAALPAVLRAECAGGRCRGITPDPYADLLAVVQRLDKGTIPANQLTIVQLGLALLTSDVDADLRAELPAGLAAARRGDAALLRHAGEAAALPAPDDPRRSSQGLFLAASCEDYATPWDRSTTDPDARRAESRKRFDAIPSRRFAPFDPNLVYLAFDPAYCAGWPALAESPAVTGPLPDVPALVLSGGADLRVPTPVARRVAAQFPHGRLFVVTATGHAVVGDEPCGQRVVAAYLRGRPLPACPPARAAFPPLPLPPKRLADLAPPAGASGTRGRLAAAALLTLRFAATDAAARADAQRGRTTTDRFGGLRGGTVRRLGDAIALERVEVIPGVRVSGTPARLSATGAGQTVVLRHGRV